MALQHPEIVSQGAVDLATKQFKEMCDTWLAELGPKSRRAFDRTKAKADADAAVAPGAGRSRTGWEQAPGTWWKAKAAAYQAKRSLDKTPKEYAPISGAGWLEEPQPWAFLLWAWRFLELNGESQQGHWGTAKGGAPPELGPPRWSPANEGPYRTEALPDGDWTEAAIFGVPAVQHERTRSQLMIAKALERAAVLPLCQGCGGYAHVIGK
jgi:hypothetical protein